jgi:hypothetical protein
MKDMTMTQSALDERAEYNARAARGEIVDPKKWFDVADSMFMDDDGNEYYNVQAKFTDHYILNIEKSQEARHNVFDVGIVLHTKVLRVTDASPAIKNSSSHVMRFDKGEDRRVASYRPGPDGKEVIHYEGSEGMGQQAFDAAVRDIMRCWDAWVHYQLYRTAPVHPLETKALDIIAKKPLHELGTVIVDRGDGKFETVRLETEDEDDDDPADAPKLPGPVRTAKPKPKRKKAA